ncbi:MAG: 30S ribosomal protein S17 [Candidatus Omnitrophota bacterium]|nr:MAG: 30S ribosomal protein S17 [Candidatus Omnitrophota bacterium]
MEHKRPRKKILEGIVVSDKMDKTIVVAVTKKLFHSLYKKIIVKRKRYKVHDEENKAKTLDRVKIIESRPYSKEKKFRLLEIIK